MERTWRPYAFEAFQNRRTRIDEHKTSVQVSMRRGQIEARCSEHHHRISGLSQVEDAGEKALDCFGGVPPVEIKWVWWRQQGQGGVHGHPILHGGSLARRPVIRGFDGS